MNKVDNWGVIKKLIKDANERQMDQPKMAEFLKNQFDSILDILEGLVHEGIDLSDRTVVSHLMELKFALHQIPQSRVFAFNVSTVIEEFDVYVKKFFHILSLPKQDAETSFTCSWIVDRLDALAERISEERDDDMIEKTPNRLIFYLDQLMSYLEICQTLCENGSDMIKAYVVDSAERVADVITSENLLREARCYWQFVIFLLSQNNLRITQREGRLALARKNYIHLNESYVIEHRIDVTKVAQSLRHQWIDVPEGNVSFGERVFHVGAFKISQSLVTISQWSKVMETENQLSRKPVTGISFVEAISFVTLLNMCWEEAGRISIPTEAQLMLARQTGVLVPHHNCSEICYTQYREFNEMGNHHFIDNLPTDETCKVVVRDSHGRFPLPYKPDNDSSIGFRLVLVDYDERRDINDLLEMFKDELK